MLFSSAIFLFLFLPILLASYYLAPKKLKNLLLLLASLAFYTYGEQKMVLLLLASIFVDFFAAIIIEKHNKRIGLAISLVFNLSILFYFKYIAFAFENYYATLEFLGLQGETIKNIPKVALPLGISFFTFQTMSYSLDVYFGKLKASKNIINFGTYVTMFPQLIAGPIVRYIDVEKQLKNRTLSTAKFAEGVERFVIGLAKKMLIANNVAYIADGAFNLPTEQLSTGFAWLGIIAYTLQIYFDFSGYSDMAIGLGKMLGFNILENFNYPYISKSIREFWRRWHISLSTWFRDYVYIPLGGNRKGNIRTYINLWIVFFVTGLWHGASWNFIIWGLIHGFFIVIERLGFDKMLFKLPKLIQHLYTLLIVAFAWVFFKAYDLPRALGFLKKMFSFDFTTNSDIFNFYIRTEGIVALMLGFIFSMNIYGLIKNKMNNATPYYVLKYVTVVVLFCLSILYIAVDSYNPFIYFRF